MNRVPVVDEVLADLAAEGDDLDAMVSGIDAGQWRLATPAPGWTIANQISHLASSDRLAALAATDAEAFEVRRAKMIAVFDEAVGTDAAEFASEPPERLLSVWREARFGLQSALARVPEGQRVPWIVAPVSAATLATTRLMELFGHGQDVADALGVRRPVTDRIVHVARLGVRTRDYAFLARGLTPPAEEFRIELSSPEGEVWSWGPQDAAQGVSGPAADFCLLVTQRRHRDDLRLAVRGADANRWLSFAQAYAGPPGPGRAAGQFGA